MYGTLDGDTNDQFVPELYVADRQLENAEELVGRHGLGTPLRALGDIGRNPVARQDLRDQLLGRTTALAELIVGLSHFAVNQPQPALDHFLAARDSGSWDDRDGKDTLYVFLGHTTAELGDLSGAASFYDLALSLNAGYVCAGLGRAETLFQMARGTCEMGHADAAGLDRSIAAFQGTLAAAADPPLADLARKVDLSVGRVLLCRSQALIADDWEEAGRRFRAVIDEYEGGNHRLRDLAAEASADLGFVHLPAAGATDAAERYRRAASDYQRAIDLSRHDERKAFFSSMRGMALARLGDDAGANQAYGRAVVLTRDPAAKAGYERARSDLARP